MRNLLSIHNSQMHQQSSIRVVYLDILRTLATFAVIALHVYSQGDSHLVYGNYYWCLAVVGESVAKWAVPIFLMISGTIFLNPNRAITVEDLLKKRIPRLLIAYLFWWMAYSARMCILTSIKNGSLTITPSMIQPWFHLWFLPLLACVYLLIPILRKVAENRKLTRYVLIIWICYIGISFVLTSFSFKYETPQIWNLFRADQLIGYAGYFLLGQYLSHSTLSKTQRQTTYIIGAISVLIMIWGNIVMSHLDGDINNIFMNCLSIHTILMTSALFVWAKEYSHKIGPRIIGFMDYTRKDLFGIYLVHAMWLPIINTSSLRNLCNQAITLPLICIAIFVLSLYTTKLIRLIPKLHKVVE